MTSKTLLRCGAAGLALTAALTGFGGVAAAQTASAPAAAPAADVPIGEVIVTAQRRKERLQDVPIAITNLNAQQVVAQQINATSDIPRLVPNMTTTNNTGTGSGNVYFLRGLGQTESFATFDPQVGIYVDDIYIGRGSAANFDLADVEQIQVLRGPQGTLFGRNSTGGAIVINLQKPTSVFGGYAEAGYGAYNRFFAQGAVNIPISDQILTKTTFYSVKDDGYVKDVATGSHLNYHADYGLREAVTIKPAALSNVVWNLSTDVSQSKYNNEANFVQDGQRISYSGFGDTGAAVPVIGAAPVIADAQSILKEPFTSLPNGEEIQTWGAMSNVEVKLSGGTLNFITGFRGQTQLGSADFPFPAVSGALQPYDDNELGQFGIFLNATDRQYSQEIKWSGELGEKLKYTAGVFYLYERNSTTFVETLTVPVGPVTAPSVFGFELSSPEHFKNTTSSVAGYLQGDYKLTDKLTLTLGGRFTDEHKTYRVNSTALNGVNGYDTADVVAGGHSVNLKADEFTPRLALEYKIDPDLMVFASATEGFQGGGWNSLTAAATTVTTFGPETVWSYETGIRSELLDHKMIINADVFYENVKNYQLVTLGPGSGNFVTENAASFWADGLEVDATYHPIKDLSLRGSFGLETGGYFDPSATTAAQQAACKASGPTGPDCTQGIVNAAGALAPPEDFPHASFNLDASYVIRGNSFDFTPSAAVQYMSQVHVDTSGATDGLSPDHAIMDLRALFQWHGAPWNLTVECENCLNTQYQTQLLFVKYYNAPGIWDVKVRYKF